MSELLITEKYPSVVATRFRLISRIMKNGEQVWNTNCPARVNEGKGLQVSEYIEEMNSVDNNVYFEIDVEATIAAHERNRERAAKRLADAKDNNMTNADVLKTIASGMEVLAGGKKSEKKAKTVEVVELPEGEPDDTWEVEQLQQYCTDNEIGFHHKNKSAKLLELIKNK